MYHRFPHVLWPERARIPCGTYATADKCEESGLGALAMLFLSFGLNFFNTSPASEYAREIPVFELLDTFSVRGRSLWQVEARSQGGTWQVWWAGLRDARWDASSTTARNKFPSSYLLQRLADAR